MPAHLSKGSVDPPLQEGKLRLYSMRYCPFAQRAHLVLLAKNIPHDPVYINLKEKPEWYVSSVPTGKVPALKSEGACLYESLIICDYLDEKYEGRKLNSDIPLQRALDRIFLESLGKIQSSMYLCVMGSELNEEVFGELLNNLEILEKELKSRGTPYLGGSIPGMIDYMVWPLGERLPMIAVLGGFQYKIPNDRFANVLKWCSLMKEDEVVKQFYASPETHAQHINLRKSGLSTAFDI